MTETALDPFLRTAREAVRKRLDAGDPGYMCEGCEPEDAWSEFSAGELSALLRQQDAKTREALAQAMTDLGFATGHGDTHADLLVELVGEVREERTRVLEEILALPGRGPGRNIRRVWVEEMLAALKASSGEEKPRPKVRLCSRCGGMIAGRMCGCEMPE